MDYGKMMAFHQRMKADATVGVVRVLIEEAHRFGTVTLDGEGRITEFVEKSSRPWMTLPQSGFVQGPLLFLRRCYPFNASALGETLRLFLAARV